MHVLVGPAMRRGGGMDPVDHALGTADIDMGAQRLAIQQILKPDGLILIVEIDMHLVGMLIGQLVHIGAQLSRAAGVMQLPGAAHPFQMRDHRQERRDADAAGQEHMLAPAQIQREQVHRKGDGHRVADLDLVVQEQRAAPALVVAAYRDRIDAIIARIGHQRIGVQPGPLAIAHLDNGMGTGGKGRKRLAIAAGEFEPGDQRVERHDGADGDLDLFGACLGFLGGCTHL